ncbi:hypothetical protein TNCV_3894521 [Trichonephila clavipes]|nr:hypothetical protein TNCV_3894521 [Trichonephila clavipes]
MEIESVEDDEPAGRPRLAITKQNVAEVRDMREFLLTLVVSRSVATTVSAVSMIRGPQDLGVPNTHVSKKIAKYQGALSEKANGSSLPAPSPPPNRHNDDRIVSWEEKGERGHNVTCVISVQKLDDCSPPIGQLAHLPTIGGGPFPLDPGTSINGCMRCSDITV